MIEHVEQFSAEELEAPKWLNKEFFAKVLAHCEKSASVNVKNVQIKPAAKKADHYASAMYRAKVEYQLNSNEKYCQKSMIIKTMPEIGSKKEFFSETNIFDTEIGMYTEVLRRFEKILRDIGDDTILVATCLYHSLSPKKVIIFEDLVEQGYATFETSTNLEQAKCALMKLAKWQAISYKINLETPEYFDKYRGGLFNMKAMIDSDFFINGVRNFVELLEKTPTLRKYKPYFERVQDTLLDECKNSFNEFHKNPRKNAYYVLNHGDFHVKNLMLKQNAETGKWEDLLLLDFQVCYIGPIANDLLNAMYMLIDDNLRPAHINELIYYYFTIFTETLNKIGYSGEMPKFRVFLEQLFWHKHWELYLMTTFLPVWEGIRNGSLDADRLFTSKDYAKLPLQNEKYIKEVHTLLERYEHLGYFLE